MKRKRKFVMEKVPVSGYAAEGKALAKIEGKVIFIEGAVPGDVVDELDQADFPRPLQASRSSSKGKSERSSGALSVTSTICSSLTPSVPPFSPM